MIHKSKRQSSQVYFVLRPSIFHSIIFVEVFLFKELSGLFYLENCTALNVSEFRMRPEKVFDFSGNHRDYSEGPRFVKVNILDGRRSGQVRVRCGDDCVEVTEQLFRCDFEGQVGADYFQRVILTINYVVPQLGKTESSIIETVLPLHARGTILPLLLFCPRLCPCSCWSPCSCSVFSSSFSCLCRASCPPPHSSQYLPEEDGGWDPCKLSSPSLIINIMTQNWKVHQKFIFEPQELILSKNVSNFNKMFPQLHQRHLLMTKISVNLLSKNSIIHEQSRFNIFLELARSEQKTLLSYSLIDVSFVKKSELVYIVDLKDEVVCGNIDEVLTMMLRAEYVKNKSVNIASFKKQMKRLWTLFQQNLRKIKTIFSNSRQIESLIKNNYDFTLVRNKTTNEYVIKTKLGPGKEQPNFFFFSQFGIYHERKIFAKLVQVIETQTPKKKDIKNIKIAFEDIVKQVTQEQYQLMCQNREEGQVQMKEVAVRPQIIRGTNLQMILEQSMESENNSFMSDESESVDKFPHLSNSKLLRQMQESLGYTFLDEKEADQMVRSIYIEHFKHMMQYAIESSKKIGANESTNHTVEWSIVEVKKSVHLQNLIIVLPGVLMKNWILAESHLLYSIKFKTFKYLQKYKFYNYAHFVHYVVHLMNIKIRKQNIYYLSKQEKISVHENFENRRVLITTPVRGKYCRHLQFYDLRKVFMEMQRQSSNINSENNSPNDSFDNKQNEEEEKRSEVKKDTRVCLAEGFDCFVCGKYIELQNLMYLEEMKLLIKFIIESYIKPQQRLMKETEEEERGGAKGRISDQEGEEEVQFWKANQLQDWKVWLNVDHIEQAVDLEIKYKDNRPSREEMAHVYYTLVDPLQKFRKKCKNFQFNCLPSISKDEFDLFDQNGQLQRLLIAEQEEEECEALNMTVAYE